MIASYLALLMKEDGVSDTEIGLLAIPFSLSLMISNSISGRLSDYRGRKQFILIGLILSSLSTSFFIFSLNLWTYFLARIFNGIALGIFPSSLIGLASDNKVKLGWLSSFGSMGWAFGGLLGGFLADKYSLSFVFIYSSFMYLSAFIISLFLQDDSNVIKSSRDNSREIFYSEVIRKNWLIYLIVILRHGTANAIWIFWPIFLSEELNLSITQIGVVQATNMFTQFIFMQILGDKLDPRKMYFVGSIFSSLAFYSFTLVSNFYEIVGTQIILGFSWALFYVGGLRRVEERSRQSNAVATATGLYNSSISIAQIVGPFIALFFLRFSDSFVNTMLFAAVVTIFAGTFYGLNELYPRKSNAIST
ncbi:MAG: MFS transporter [Candidatus Heimdallarchaeota archaeon]|nr:MFS transporter [Candidatus Heimdallarchaeota archaeon]